MEIITFAMGIIIIALYIKCQRLPPVRKRKIKEAMRAIAHDPACGKALQQELAGLCSYRIGTLRIVYTLNRTKRIVHVIALGPRQTIYEEVEKTLRSFGRGPKNLL